MLDLFSLRQMVNECLDQLQEVLLLGYQEIINSGIEIEEQFLSDSIDLSYLLSYYISYFDVVQGTFPELIRFLQAGDKPVQDPPARGQVLQERLGTSEAVRDRAGLEAL